MSPCHPFFVILVRDKLDAAELMDSVPMLIRVISNNVRYYCVSGTDLLKRLLATRCVNYTVYNKVINVPYKCLCWFLYDCTFESMLLPHQDRIPSITTLLKFVRSILDPSVANQPYFDQYTRLPAELGYETVQELWDNIQQARQVRYPAADDAVSNSDNSDVEGEQQNGDGLDPRDVARERRKRENKARSDRDYLRRRTERDVNHCEGCQRFAEARGVQHGAFYCGVHEHHDVMDLPAIPQVLRGAGMYLIL